MTPVGEARRRRERQKETVEAERLAAERYRANWDEIERIASEDPDDRSIREAHGLSWDDDWNNPEQLCRNGCGETYHDIVSGKMRTCSAVTEQA